MIFWLVLKLEIGYRVMISWKNLVSLRGFFWRLYFCIVKYLNFHNSFFKWCFNVNGKATMWYTPCSLRKVIKFYFFNLIILRQNTNLEMKRRNTKRGPTSKIETMPKSKREQKTLTQIQFPSLHCKLLTNHVKQIKPKA